MTATGLPPLHPAEPRPGVRYVTVRKLVSLSLPVIPGLGVRLLFPRAVHGHGGRPLSAVLTNRRMFTLSRGDAQGNALVVTATGRVRGVADLFIDAGQYQVTVQLKVAALHSRYVSDVVFQRPSHSGTAATHYCEEGKVMDEGRDGLKTLAVYEAAPHVVSWVKQRAERRTAANVDLVLKVRDQTRGQGFRVFRFSVEDVQRRPLTVQEVTLVTAGPKGDIGDAIPVGWSVTEAGVHWRRRGVVTASGPVGPDRYLVLQVMTNLGQVFARW